MRCAISGATEGHGSFNQMTASSAVTLRQIRGQTDRTWHPAGYFEWLTRSSYCLVSRGNKSPWDLQSNRHPPCSKNLICCTHDRLVPPWGKNREEDLKECLRLLGRTNTGVQTSLHHYYTSHDVCTATDEVSDRKHVYHARRKHTYHARRKHVYHARRKHTYHARRKHRITQGGNTRITQGGNTRITQGGNTCITQGGNTCNTQGGNTCITQGGNTCITQGGNQKFNRTQLFIPAAFFVDNWPLKMGPIGSPETSVLNNLHRITS